MKVILLKTVPKVGKSGDVVDVSDGYAANALFPTKLAIAATPKNLEALHRKVQSHADMKALEHGLLKQAIETLPSLTLEIVARANDKGHLFSKIDAVTIVEALLDRRISISPKNIILKEPIKSVGTYPVTIQEGSYSVSISVVVVPIK